MKPLIVSNRKKALPDPVSIENKNPVVLPESEAIEALQAEKNALATSLEEANAEILELRGPEGVGTYAEIQESLAQVTQQRDEVLVSNQGHMGSMKALHAENEELRGLLETKDKAIDDLAKENSDSKKQIGILEKEVKKLSKAKA